MTRRSKLALTAAASALAAFSLVVLVSNLSSPAALAGIAATYAALALNLRLITIAPSAHASRFDAEPATAG